MLIKESQIFLDPFKHIFCEEFVSQDLADQLCKNFPDYYDNIWDLHGKHFDTEYGQKKEFQIINLMHSSYKHFFDHIRSKKFIDRVSEIFEMNDLFFDDKLYGGGLNIYAPGAKLDPHIDFNYNNDLGAYRAINLLYYLNKNWNPENGGQLQLYSENNQLIKSIAPTQNSCIIFAPNQKTIHGVSNVKNFYRMSVSVWYYTKNPPKNVPQNPQKTKWLKTT